MAPAGPKRLTSPRRLHRIVELGEDHAARARDADHLGERGLDGLHVGQDLERAGHVERRIRVGELEHASLANVETPRSGPCRACPGERSMPRALFGDLGQPLEQEAGAAPDLEKVRPRRRSGSRNRPRGRRPARGSRRGRWHPGASRNPSKTRRNRPAFGGRALRAGGPSSMESEHIRRGSSFPRTFGVQRGDGP